MTTEDEPIKITMDIDPAVFGVTAVAVIAGTMQDLRKALSRVLALYPESFGLDGAPRRLMHETMLRNVLASCALGGPVEEELTRAVLGKERT
jgi:hypothetical protein